MKMHKAEYRTYSHRDAEVWELGSIFFSKCSLFDSFQSSHFHAGLLLLSLHAATTWTGGTITRKQMATQERCLPMSFSRGMSRDSVWLFVPRAKNTWLTYTETGKTCSLANSTKISILWYGLIHKRTTTFGLTFHQSNNLTQNKSYQLVSDEMVSKIWEFQTLSMVWLRRK